MHSMLKASIATLATTAIMAGGALAGSHAKLTGDLKIISDMSNPSPRAVMEGLVAQFQELNPDLNIELDIVDREAWKTQIRNALGANPPDVVNWYAANRMGPYVAAGLFEDVSDMWESGELEGLDSVKGAMTIDGKQWGVPYTYYQWGVYYREDIFNELGLEEPATFDQELANCQKILDAGKKCYAIGTKFLWTAGGWFDYMNMRTNGFDFPHATCPRRGRVDRRARARNLRQLAQADRYGRLYRRPPVIQLAGSAEPDDERRCDRLSDRQLSLWRRCVTLAFRTIRSTSTSSR